MRALVLDGALSLRDVAPPARPNECRIRVTLAGICGTDLQLCRGYAGFVGIPGHEFVGTVEAAPPASRHLEGCRVVGEINVGCGDCRWCAEDLKEHCPQRSVLGIKHRAGAFAEYLWLPPANLHVVPPSIEDRAAVLIEPLAAAGRILSQIGDHPAERVAVLGDGRLGLLVGLVLRTSGRRVVLLGKHDRKLAAARQLGLATARSTDASLDDAGFDVVVEATGRPDGLDRALRLVRPLGTIVLKSTYHGHAELELWPAVVHEVRLVGSRCGSFSDALERLTSGAIDVRPLVSDVIALEGFERGFAAAASGRKVLLEP